MKISNNQIPLALYREIAAHLRQIEGVTVSFLTSTSRNFSYTGSQIGGLEIANVDRATDSAKMQIDSLLKYYADRYYPWEIEVQSSIDSVQAE